MSGLLFENNKHAIAKVRENANRHYATNWAKLNKLDRVQTTKLI